MRRPISIVLAIVAAVLLQIMVQGCSRDETYTADPRYRLSFSADTLSMDTVLAGTASATKRFAIYNGGPEGIRFNAVLAGGQTSPFELIIDGTAGPVFSDIAVGAHDSLICFVRISPQQADSSWYSNFKDSVSFILESGVVQQLQLVSTSVNVIRLGAFSVQTDMTLSADLPYLVTDTLHVCKGSRLTISPGACLLFHNKAVLQVDGTVLAVGLQDSVITFRGDRMDNLLASLPYDLLDGQWGGIVLGSESFGNRFDFCDIHGGLFGIRADSSNVTDTKFSMYSSIVHNVSGNAIEVSSSRVITGNSRITNAGKYCIDITGGKWESVFCTVALISVWEAGTVAVNVRDRTDEGYPVTFEGVSFRNSIITGRHNTELAVSDSVKSLFSDRISISNCLVLTADSCQPFFHNSLFESTADGYYGAANFTDFSRHGYDCIFTLDSLSRARGLADSLSAAYPLDLTGRQRPAIHADAGCYQSPFSE